MQNLLKEIEELDNKLLELKFTEKYRAEIIKEFIRSKRYKKALKKVPRMNVLDYITAKKA